MKIAMPLIANKVSQHFGHSENFLIANVDKDAKTVLGKQLVVPPPHEPGVLPKWLKELGVNCLITCGIGQRAVELFNQSGVNVIAGIEPQDADTVIDLFLNDKLESGKNACDH
ncbi:MAG: NifB/NifX family molybdenum-iron cluster-binding protein [Phycisphaerae bacterium]|jgi:predicted Fe-Mo cluster-binding NifX family protein